MEKCREEIAFWETRGRDICRKALWKTVITEAISTLAELGDSSFFEKYRSSCHAASQESYTRWRPVLMGYAAIMRTLGIEPPAVLPERIQHAINTHFEAREKGRRGV